MILEQLERPPAPANETQQLPTDDWAILVRRSKAIAAAWFAELRTDNGATVVEVLGPEPDIRRAFDRAVEAIKRRRGLL